MGLEIQRISTMIRAVEKFIKENKLEDVLSYRRNVGQFNFHIFSTTFTIHDHEISEDNLIETLSNRCLKHIISVYQADRDSWSKTITSERFLRNRYQELLEANL